MKRVVLIVIGGLLAAAVIAAASIAVYEHFRPSSGWGSTAPAIERQGRPQVGTPRTRGMSEDVRSGSLLPLAQALDLAAARLPGEVLKVELEDKHGRSIYEIKVLADNGRVREIELDARSGEVLEIEDD